MMINKEVDNQLMMPDLLVMLRGKTQMYSVKLLSQWENKLHKEGTVLVINSPVRASRDYKSMMVALDGWIEIGGVIYYPKGFDLNCISGDVQVGEKIGIFVDVKVWFNSGYTSTQKATTNVEI